MTAGASLNELILVWLGCIVLVVALAITVIVSVTKRTARNLRRRRHRAAARLAWVFGILFGLLAFRQQLHSQAARILAVVIVLGVVVTALRSTRQPH
jgi:threonine/homoserine/homoserine lactone efflux protein